MLEAIRLAEDVTGRKMDYEYVEDNRIGDHICYISDLTKMKNDFPGWGITKSLQNIFEEIAGVIN
jgi:CDP-paratose 2-epimerase